MYLLRMGNILRRGECFIMLIVMYRANYYCVECVYILHGAFVILVLILILNLFMVTLA